MGETQNSNIYQSYVLKGGGGGPTIHLREEGGVTSWLKEVKISYQGPVLGLSRRGTPQIQATDDTLKKRGKRIKQPPKEKKTGASGVEEA